VDTNQVGIDQSPKASRCQADALRSLNREHAELCEEAEARGREEEQQVGCTESARGGCETPTKSWVSTNKAKRLAC
jgi:hypothetical protein